MNFGQALAALLNGGRVSCPELGKPGAFIARQLPAGAITEPFIGLHLANGICTPWSPTQEAILANNWTNVEAGKNDRERESQRAEQVGANR